MAKPAFDPNKPFEVSEMRGGAKKPAFDPDQPFEAGEAPSSNDISKSESAARGAAQGATLGFADEISGGVEALWEKAQGNPTEFGKLYQAARDESRANFESAQKANPKTYGSAEIGTGIATAFIPGMAAARGAKLASVAAKSAGIGAAAGTGYSEGETAGEVLTDTTIGAGLGGAASFAAPVIGKAAARGGKALKRSAERFAARAIGAERGTIKKIGQDKVQEAGRYALDNKIISPLANTDEKIARNNAVKKNVMDQRQSAYDKIDEAKAGTFRPLEVATELEKKVIGDKNRSYLDTQELIKKLDPELENILSRGEGSISMKDAQELVANLSRKAKFDTSRSTETNDLMKTVYSTVREAVNKAADEGASQIKIEKVVRDANKAFSTAKNAETLLENKLAREQGNKLIGLTDWALLGGSGIGAVASGGASIPGTLGVLAAKKGAEKYGAQNAAIILDKTSKALTKAPQTAKNAAAIETVAKPIRSAVDSKLQMVAENDGDKPSTRPLKGQEKWANDGFKKLLDHSGNENMSKMKGALLKSPKGKRLLIAASDLKPGSKAFEKIASQIEKEFGGSN
jgi:hypothetical protein